ncbi:MAG: membrane protein insertion efficiency factor YidD [Ruminococcus sp.]|nr:membrane protein insertion efficiency factor YidD [Ruminococcus sp.]
MKKIFISLIRFYQCKISPLMGKGKCKFYPTCSQYAIEAISEYGAFKGTFLALWRILRCNPFSRGGYDPVKKKKH